MAGSSIARCRFVPTGIEVTDMMPCLVTNFFDNMAEKVCYSVNLGYFLANRSCIIHLPSISRGGAFYLLWDYPSFDAVHLKAVFSRR